MITIVYIERRYPKQKIIDRCLETIPNCKVQLWTDTDKFKLERCEIIRLPDYMLFAESYGAFAVYLTRFLQTTLLEHLDTSHFIMVQNDGYPINPSKWNDSFLDYDYIGAPIYYWHKHTHFIQLPYDSFYEQGLWEIGNGGFSLRSKALMKAANKLVESKNNINYYNVWEDFLICKVLRNDLEKKGLKFAPYEVAINFSREQYDVSKNTKPFGFHAGGNVAIVVDRELELIE